MTDRAAVIVAVVIAAPAALVLLFAILRGYAVHLTLRRDRRPTDDD